eukprot:2426012-Amphidinium_carterae.1
MTEIVVSTFSGASVPPLVIGADWTSMCASPEVCKADELAPSFLELYLDYLTETSFHRWPTGVADAEGGGLWRSQLAGLCSPVPPVVPSKRSASTTNRLAVFGLPVLECTLAKGSLLDEASSAIAEAKLQSAACEKWRLWAPGLPQSQMLVESSLCLVLESLPQHRLRGKCSVVRWQKQLSDRSSVDIKKAAKSLKTSLSRWLLRITSACRLLNENTHQLDGMPKNSCNFLNMK